MLPLDNRRFANIDHVLTLLERRITKSICGENNYILWYTKRSHLRPHKCKSQKMITGS